MTRKFRTFFYSVCTYIRMDRMRLGRLLYFPPLKSRKKAGWVLCNA